MKIGDALKKMSGSTKYLWRKGWPDTIFVTVCNEALYVHSHRNDPLGRGWIPTRTDLMFNDWAVGGQLRA